MALPQQSSLTIRNVEISPEYIEAVNALENKKVPEYAIDRRPGKGGQTFTYINHIWATEILQEGLQHFWSFEVLDWETWQEDRSTSIAAKVRLTVKVPYNDPGDTELKFLERVVTEVGAFEKNRGMPMAMGVASAVSRGLCRCMMRMFGIGIEFYKKDDDGITPDKAWTTLAQFAANQGLNDTHAIVNALKAKGISKHTLVDQFELAYETIAELVGSKVVEEKVPEEL